MSGWLPERELVARRGATAVFGARKKSLFVVPGRGHRQIGPGMRFPRLRQRSDRSGVGRVAMSRETVATAAPGRHLPVGPS